MEVLIIGAGVYGLATGKILSSLGHSITILEKCPDLGGVWSSTRRYPNLKTQSSKDTYFYSDLRMSEDFEESVEGEFVQRYLEGYVREHRMSEMIKFNQEVVKVERRDWFGRLENGRGWIVKTSQGLVMEMDHIVVCNGTFSKNNIPNFKGQEEFKKMGGKICHTSQMRNIVVARSDGADDGASTGGSASTIGFVEGKQYENVDPSPAPVTPLNRENVLVIGYGKSACDTANAVATHHATKRDERKHNNKNQSQPSSSSSLSYPTITLVARRLFWKMPRKLYDLINYKYILLTRFGESLFKYSTQVNYLERFFHQTWLGEVVRGWILDGVGWVVCRQLGFKELGMLPEGRFETLGESMVSLSTEGLYEKIGKGLIDMRRDVYIVQLGTKSSAQSSVSDSLPPRREESEDRKPIIGATLNDGSFIPAEIIVCGTGFKTDFPSFLPGWIRPYCIDSRGYWNLYQHIKPIGVEGITFNGYGSSLFNPTTAEVSALWIASLIERGENKMLPQREEQRLIVQKRLELLDERCRGRHSDGRSVVPFSMHIIDEMLEETGLKIGRIDRVLQWVFPVNPSHFKGLTDELRKQLDKECAQRKWNKDN